MKTINYEPMDVLSQGIDRLKKNEQKVLTERFGLGIERKTLAAIGSELSLSRERVRQIEREALRKMSEFLARIHSDKFAQLVETIDANGGIMNKDHIVASLLGKKANQTQTNALNLITMLTPEIENIERDEIIKDSWVLASVPRSEVVKILKEWAQYLKNNNKPAKIDVLIEAHPHHQKHKISFLSALPNISKNIIKNYEDNLGLSIWPEFNPRTVRDKIYYILRKNQGPMHFSEIGRAISNESFDTKKVVLATIHNELIADPRFVLIGRGIYALQEWGYKAGTVKDIIVSVLKKSGGAMTLADIYGQVSKQRQVRKNTILINLQTQKEFKRLSGDKFILA